MISLFVELSLVAPLEELEIAGDHPQRLLEIVRGDVGKFLEVGIRAAQFRGKVLEVGVGALQFGDVARHAEESGERSLLVAEPGDGEQHGDAGAVLADVGPFAGLGMSAADLRD